MRVQDVMTKNVISISPDEPVAVAARLLSRYNVGVLPVCSADQKLHGIITDRDIVLRCVAAGEDPTALTVRKAMTSRVVSASPEDSAAVASSTMAREQVRRLPVEKDGKLVGMVSLGDLAQQPDYSMEAADALADICCNIRSR